MTTIVDNDEFLQAAIQGADPSKEAIGCVAYTTPPDDPHEKVSWALRSPRHPMIADLIDSGDANTFFCISTVEKTFPLKRGHGALQALYVVPLDDIGTGEGSKDPSEVPLDPSYKLETSEGNYQYGYFTRITDMAVARALVKLVTREKGDSAAALAGKIIRLPNGYNNKLKYGGGRFKHVLRKEDWHPDRRFTVEEILDGFSIDRDEFNQLVEKFRNNPRTGIGAPALNDHVFEFLAHHGSLLSDEVGSGGFYEVLCPWHEQHTSGTHVSSFSPLGCGGDEYEKSRQWSCFHDHCSERDIQHFIEWMFQERFVYDTSSNVVHDRLRPEQRMTLEHFHTAMKPLHYQEGSKRTYFSRKWIDRVDRMQVDTEIFMPSAPQTYRNLITGRSMFNTYVPIVHAPTEKRDKIQPILDQIKYLFGSEYENALSFMAYTVHRGEIRLPFALLHIASHHGTGRGWWKLLMDRLLMHGYHQPASFHNFTSTNFNEFMYRSLLVTFDEVYDPKVRYSVGERLRELITEQEMEINVKFGAKGKMQVVSNLVFFSNHTDALKIGERDRRFWCVKCEEPPRSPEAYYELYRLLDDEGGPHSIGDAVRQFYWFLEPYADELRTPNKAFDPRGRAPKTIWHEEVQAATDDEDTSGPIRETIRQLRATSINVIWRSHFIRLAEINEAKLPSSSFASNDDKWRRFRAILRDFNVERSIQRYHSSKLLRDSFISAPTKDYILFLHRVDRRSTKKLLEEADKTIQLLRTPDANGLPPADSDSDPKSDRPLFH